MKKGMSFASIILKSGVAKVAKSRRVGLRLRCLMLLTQLQLGWNPGIVGKELRNKAEQVGSGWGRPGRTVVIGTQNRQYIGIQTQIEGTIDSKAIHFGKISKSQWGTI
jgi:hypothetical protein